MTTRRGSTSDGKAALARVLRGQRFLSGQIDRCADNVAELIVATQKEKNKAVIAGDLATADALNERAIRLSVIYGDLARHQIKTIDDSVMMEQTIKGFADVNIKIKTAIAEIKEATTFAEALTTILSTLEGLITSALLGAA